MSKMPDALAAATLLLTVLTLVYTAWSGAIQFEIERTFATNADQKAKEQKQTKGILWRRALPLSLGSTLTLIVFLPRDWSLVQDVHAYWTGPGYEYDDVCAMFALTQVFLFGLTIHFWAQFARVSGRLPKARK